MWSFPPSVKWKHLRPREGHSDRSLILALPDQEKPQLMEGLPALPYQVGPLGEPLPVPGSVSHLGQEDPSTCQVCKVALGLARARRSHYTAT